MTATEHAQTVEAGPAPHPAYAGYPPAGWAPPANGWAPPVDGWAPPAYEPPPSRLGAFTARLAARTPRWAAPAAIFTCFVGAGAFVLAANPTDSGVDAVPTCLLKLTTGFDCPGCGGTRAFWYVLHGNLPAAARHHALFLFSVPFLLYIYVAWAGGQVFGRRLPPLRLSPRAIGLFLGAWGVFTVVRNLPWEPFTRLYV
jgi:hypothetical protein